nr:DUF4097 family beta strand repeat-containing protein [Saccharomonospora marina]
MSMDDTAAEQPRGEVVRTRTFDAEGPIEIDIDVTVGRVQVHFGDGDTVVEVRDDPAAQPPWAEGAANLIGWVGEFLGGQFGAQVAGNPAAAASAAEQTRIEKLGNRLVVRAPKVPMPKATAVAVKVHAPTGSQLDVRTRLAPVTVTGTAGRVDVGTATGDVSLERAESATSVRTGSGEVNVEALRASATLATGTGDVWIGKADGAVMVRTSSGDLTVTDAGSGSVEAITGSGDIRVGIRSGVVAEVELSSGGGYVSSELDVADTEPDKPVALRVRARSGSGDASLTRAG